MSAAQHITRVSPLEEEYGVFFDTTIEAAGQAASLMRDMNRAHQIISGLGIVLRMVAGNAALHEEYDPAVQGSTPPLSKVAEGALVAMAASMCEQMRDQLEQRAMRCNAAQSEVQS